MKHVSLVIAMAFIFAAPACSDSGGCLSGYEKCEGVCTDYLTNPFHCGECGNACSLGESCEDGVCTVVCDSESTACGGTCVDTDTSLEHCGACDNACPAGEVCVDGSCEQVCGGSTDTLCGDACVDLDRNPLHCGACDSPCAAGEICTSGTCVLSCGGSTPTRCGDACVDTNTNPLHCGACDNACASGEVCDAGSCVPYCSTGLTDCSGSCFDLDNDPEHCGACDTACTSPANAAAVCVAGACDFVCTGTFQDCNVDPGDGCELDVGSTDLDNCGACGAVCETGVFSSPDCTAGVCSIVCDTGFTFCASDFMDGCTDLMTDLLNCGTCGTTCTGDELCIDGSCTDLGPTFTEITTTTATENTWLGANPYADKHDGGWVYSSSEDAIYAIYGNNNRARNVYRIDHNASTSAQVATLTYNRHGSYPVIDETGGYIYFPPSQDGSQMERMLIASPYTVTTLTSAPSGATFNQGAFKNGKLWIVLNDNYLYSYDPTTDAWTRLDSIGNRSLITAHESRGTDNIYILTVGGGFRSYDTVTATLTSLASFTTSFGLGGNGEMQFVPSAEGLEYGFIYAMGGCSGDPRIYSIHDDTWSAPADLHSNSNCVGHSTYDTTARRLYVADGASRVWVYQY